MLMNHPFVRSLLHRPVQQQHVTINSAQPDFDIEISYLFLVVHAWVLQLNFGVKLKKMNWTLQQWKLCLINNSILVEK